MSPAAPGRALLRRLLSSAARERLSRPRGDARVRIGTGTTDPVLAAYLYLGDAVAVLRIDACDGTRSSMP
ncbi:hypothetical protein ACRAWF_13270 [Streptomyces sp. L7]